MQTCYFGYSEHAWIHTLKIIVSIVENLDVYLNAKNKLRDSLLSWDITFQRILQFDWPTAFWVITWELEFCQIWGWWWNINNNISFHFRLFPGKTNDKVFPKKSKKTYFRAILGPFFPNLSKNEFSAKRALSVFKYSSYLPSCKKSEKTNELFLRKTQTDGRMDRRPDRQTNKGDF